MSVAIYSMVHVLNHNWVQSRPLDPSIDKMAHSSAWKTDKLWTCYTLFNTDFLHLEPGEQERVLERKLVF